MRCKEEAIGGLLLVASIATTGVYESALVRSVRSFEEGRAVAIALPQPRVSSRTEDHLVVFSGLITTAVSTDGTTAGQEHKRPKSDRVPLRGQSPVVLDGTFGIAAKGVRLYRHVEMLQWVETSHTSMSSAPEDEDQRFDDDRERTYMYDMRWSEERIDSMAFHDPSYANPPPEAWTYTSLVVTAADLVVGEYGLPEELVDQIARRDVVHLDTASRRVMANVLEQRKGTGWQRASALTNVSVTDDCFYFQSEEPVLGDQRVHFDVTPNYPVTVCAKQKGRELVPFTSSTGEALFLLKDGIMTAHELFDKATHAEVSKNRFFRLFAGVLGFIGFLVLRSPLIERYGSLLAGIPQHLLASSLSAALTFSVVGATWSLYSPLWALLLWLGGCTPLVGLFLVFRSTQPLKAQ
ncbi:unnamed protein product [Hyaloperonospora brassicae]|uniref:Transmembrane protein 43 n=1 Tax=Hyaloperonospora brassicae TaxID=162125 RepID=A0AAV0UAU1_HYABA|nr:unnamed protein product [Hyaloperonospora brassicae]